MTPLSPVSETTRRMSALHLELPKVEGPESERLGSLTPQNGGKTTRERLIEALENDDTVALNRFLGKEQDQLTTLEHAVYLVTKLKNFSADEQTDVVSSILVLSKRFIHMVKCNKCRWADFADLLLTNPRSSDLADFLKKHEDPAKEGVDERFILCTWGQITRGVNYITNESLCLEVTDFFKRDWLHSQTKSSKNLTVLLLAFAMGSKEITKTAEIKELAIRYQVPLLQCIAKIEDSELGYYYLKRFSNLTLCKNEPQTWPLVQLFSDHSINLMHTILQACKTFSLDPSLCLAILDNCKTRAGDMSEMIQKCEMVEFVLDSVKMVDVAFVQNFLTRLCLLSDDECTLYEPRVAEILDKNWAVSEFIQLPVERNYYEEGSSLLLSISKLFHKLGFDINRVSYCYALAVIDDFARFNEKLGSLSPNARKRCENQISKIKESVYNLIVYLIENSPVDTQPQLLAQLDKAISCDQGFKNII